MQTCAIVFGGAGFIGTHLCRRLVAEGRHRVVIADQRPPLRPVDGVGFHQVDVRHVEAFEPPGPVEVIYNLAAVHTTPGHPPHAYFETNVAGATQVTAFARRHAVPTVVFTSSISVYGPSEDTKTEASAPTPETAYGWSKWLAEGIHRAWRDEDPTRRLVIVRPGAIFGPGEGGNFTRMARLLERGLFVFPGRTDTIKACFYVEDLINAILYAEARPERSILFNGTYPDRYSIGDIVETMRAMQFPRAHTVRLPQSPLLLAAALLRPFALAGLGVHPDRVRKLMISTDILPDWLTSEGMAPRGRLEPAFEHWRQMTGGRFA